MDKHIGNKKKSGAFFIGVSGLLSMVESLNLF